MKFTMQEAKALTTFQPLTHIQLKEREQKEGFSATLEELARADAAVEQPEGPEWWLNKLLSPLKSQQPPASDYQLAKAENEARRGLGMAPNADTLFTQYFEEELSKLIRAGNEPSPELIQMIRERVQDRVDAEVKAWYEQQQESQEYLRLQQLAEFEMPQQRAPQQFTVEHSTFEIQQESLDQENPFMTPAAKQMNRPPAADGDAETLLDEIKQAQSENASLQRQS